MDITGHHWTSMGGHLSICFTQKLNTQRRKLCCHRTPTMEECKQHLGLRWSSESSQAKITLYLCTRSTMMYGIVCACAATHLYYLSCLCLSCLSYLSYLSRLPHRYIISHAILSSLIFSYLVLSYHLILSFVSLLILSYPICLPAYLSIYLIYLIYLLYPMHLIYLIYLSIYLIYLTHLIHLIHLIHQIRQIYLLYLI